MNLNGIYANWTVLNQHLNTIPLSMGRFKRTDRAAIKRFQFAYPTTIVWQTKM